MRSFLSSVTQTVLVAIVKAKTQPILVLSKACQKQMVDEARLKFPLETGGVLLGSLSLDGERAVVSHIIGPGPKAVHSASLFVPDHDYHDHEVISIYRSSAGAARYVGDWHTHPTSTAYLSSLDRQTLEFIARSPEAQLPKPFMLVWGGRGAKWRAGAWQLTIVQSNRHRSQIKIESAILKSR